VNVFTAELISDLGAFNEFDIMRYSAAAEQERNGSDSGRAGHSAVAGFVYFRIRGQTATRARNYFETNLSLDTFNTEDDRRSSRSQRISSASVARVAFTTLAPSRRSWAAIP